MARMEDKDQPWIGNYPPLDAHNAHCMWQLTYPGRTPSMHVECWTLPAGKGVCIVTVQSHGRGWDIFTPHNGNKIDSSLADAEERLGVK